MNSPPLWDEAAQQFTDPRSKYYLRSSVLGGAVVTEIAQSGAKATTFIFAGGQAIAQQEAGLESGSADRVLWEHWDASRNSRLFTTASGTAGVGGGKGPIGSHAECYCALEGVPEWRKVLRVRLGVVLAV